MKPPICTSLRELQIPVHLIRVKQVCILKVTITVNSYLSNIELHRRPELRWSNAPQQTRLSKRDEGRPQKMKVGVMKDFHKDSCQLIRWGYKSNPLYAVENALSCLIQRWKSRLESIHVLRFSQSKLTIMVTKRCNSWSKWSTHVDSAKTWAIYQYSASTLEQEIVCYFLQSRRLD